MLGRNAWLRILFAVLLTLTSLGGATTVSAEPVSSYIVVLNDSVTDVPAVANEHARAFGASVRFTYGYALRGYAATLPAQALAGIQRDPRVAFISEDREVWATAQSVPTGINRIDADQSSARSGDGSGSVNVAVAVIDTGIDLAHPDLNVAGGKNCSTGRSYADGNGHGTHVAGTIAAKDDQNGVVGVVPGVKLYAVRVLNNAGSGSWSSVACGIDWVTANAHSLNIKVANMSLGGSGSDDGSCSTTKDALHKAICGSVAAGVTYVVAAGNSSADLKGFVPAAYDQVLAVTAVNDANGVPSGDSPASFSNWATTAADLAHTIAAPGVNINSTWKGGSYRTISGTSMASPHVAGTVALCIATGKCTGSPSSVISTVRADAAAQPSTYGFGGDPSTPMSGRYYGYMVYAGGY